MKVCIVTVHDSINSGSYWQAYTLGEYLKTLGHEVCYLERPVDKYASSSLNMKLKNILSRLHKYGFGEACRYIKTLREFARENVKFDKIKLDDIDNENVDCIILGSDTIWNLKAHHFRNNRDVYWGGIFKGKVIFAYAVSSGNTDFQDAELYPEIENYLSNYRGIGVRDRRTADIISKFRINKVQLVCDPTLLFKKDWYIRYLSTNISFNYIFVYLFKKPNAKEADTIMRFAHEKKYKVVCGTNKESFPDADIFIINTPNNFLNYIANASFVITDTFHGTIFSVNLEKNFIVFDREKEKVSDALYRYNLQKQLFKRGDSLELLLRSDIQLDRSMSRIEEHRKQSKEFLKSMLEYEVM